MSKRLLYGYLFIFMLISVSYYFSGISGILKFIAIYSIYVGISFIVYWIIKKIFGRTSLNIVEFAIFYTYKLSIIISFICIILGSFFYYQNNINPAKMPLYTLSNGEKTLKIQAMSHIAQESFYQGVQRNIAYAKNDGYVLFYEGVRGGTQKNEEIFQQALGVKITPELYKNFANLYGVSHQKQDDFLSIRNDLDYNIDLDIDTIVKIYLKKIPEEKREKYNSTDDSLVKEDITADVLEQVSELNEKQLQVLRYVNQALLNFMIKHDTLRNQIISRLDVEDIFGVILDDRNRYIAQKILTSNQDKIFAMYGLMHLEGIKKLLQESDNNWKVIDTTYSYPISSPGTFLDKFGL